MTRKQQSDSAQLAAGDVVEAKVERIVPGGLGLCRLDGLTLFVALAAPGDRVRARVQRVQGRTAFGEIEELVEPSPERAVPFCPYFGTCGGCDFQHLAYDAQLAAKTEIVLDCLRRIAAIPEPPAVDIVGSPEPIAYRSRAEWQLTSTAIGYFARNSHTVVDIEACPVLVPELANALAWVRDARRPGQRRSIELQAAAGVNALSVSPPIAGLQNDTIEVEIAGERYRFNTDCFFQTNVPILPALVEEALRFADQAAESSRAENAAQGGLGKSTAIDLFSGVGLFTIPLARNFDRVTAVEIHKLATSFAEQNVNLAGLTNVRVTPMPVDRWLRTRARSLKHVGLALVDPPRSGLGRAVVEGLIQLQPHWIAYLSCDPATLARDIRALQGGGYSLERVTAFDMFPQTHHVETVAHLKYVK